MVSSRIAALMMGGLAVCVLAISQQSQPPAQGAQTKGDPQLPTFGAQANEVILPVTVTDDKGKFVSNLVASDFRVLDEGRPQKIQFFSHAEKQPIVVGFLIDQSNASKIHWTKYQEAIQELIWNLLPGDKRYTGYLISYANTADILVNTTWDQDKLTERVRKMKPGGGSALYDAIYLACTRRDLVKGEPYEPRRVIVVVGDGHDTASTHTLDEVLELAQRNLVTIYGVSTMAFGFVNGDKDTLEKLTRETGGHVEYPLDRLYKGVSGYLSNPSDDGNYALTVGTGSYAAEIMSGITRAVGGIGGEITTQYVIRYTPDVDDAKTKVFRRIKVEIPKLPNVKVFARNGYYPNGVPGGMPAAPQAPAAPAK